MFNHATDFNYSGIADAPETRRHTVTVKIERAKVRFPASSSWRFKKKGGTNKAPLGRLRLVTLLLYTRAVLPSTSTKSFQARFRASWGPPSALVEGFSTGLYWRVWSLGRKERGAWRERGAIRSCGTEDLADKGSRRDTFWHLFCAHGLTAIARG